MIPGSTPLNSSGIYVSPWWLNPTADETTFHINVRNETGKMNRFISGSMHESPNVNCCNGSDTTIAELVGTIDSFIRTLDVSKSKGQRQESNYLLLQPGHDEDASNLESSIMNNKIQERSEEAQNHYSFTKQVEEASQNNPTEVDTCTPKFVSLPQKRLVVQHEYHDYADFEINSNSNSDGVITTGRTTSAKSDAKRRRKSRTVHSTSFPQNLHMILERACDNGYDHIISWQCHGRAFRVHDQTKFIHIIMPRFFQQTRFASFQRQLALYGFIRLTRKGKDFGAYYHQRFLRGHAELSGSIQRTPVKGTWIQKLPSPDTEPDFYVMTPVGATEQAARNISSESLQIEGSLSGVGQSAFGESIVFQQPETGDRNFSARTCISYSDFAITWHHQDNEHGYPYVFNSSNQQNMVNSVKHEFLAPLSMHAASNHSSDKSSGSTTLLKERQDQNLFTDLMMCHPLSSYQIPRKLEETGDASSDDGEKYSLVKGVGRITTLDSDLYTSSEGDDDDNISLANYLNDVDL